MYLSDSFVDSHPPINSGRCYMIKDVAFARELGPYAYCTAKGIALHGDTLSHLPSIPDASVDMIFTSPPFALRRKKRYGNEPPEKYVDWFVEFARHFKRILKDTGSLVIDIGGSWNPGQPTKSLYHYKLLIALVEEVGFHLAQEIFWYNPARLPTPAQWVCIERSRLKDAVNMVLWLSKTASPKADNRKVLTAYKPSQKALVEGAAYNQGARPSEHVISDKFNKDNGGAIPPNYLDEDVLCNVIRASNTSSTDHYLKGCKEIGKTPHPARIPAALPDFFVRFLTDPGDVVFDPFSGSNVTGFVAENLNRYWLAIEKESEYVLTSQTRFTSDFESLLTQCNTEAGEKCGIPK